MSSFFVILLVLGVVSVLVVVLLFLGIPILLLRSLFGKGRSSGGGGSTLPTQGQAPTIPRGFPTSMYTGSPRLSDFRVDPKLYNFKTTTPSPDLSRLREPLKVDLDGARRMFLGGSSRASGSSLDFNKARELFLPDFDTEDEDFE